MPSGKIRNHISAVLDKLRDRFGVLAIILAGAVVIQLLGLLDVIGIDQDQRHPLFGYILGQIEPVVSCRLAADQNLLRFRRLGVGVGPAEKALEADGVVCEVKWLSAQFDPAPVECPGEMNLAAYIHSEN